MTVHADHLLRSVDELESEARDRLPQSVADYIGGGAGDERTMEWERGAFHDYAIRPTVFSGVAVPDVSVSVLGSEISLPVGVAPMAYQRLVHSDGELATARAAGRAGALTVVPMLSSTRLEDVAEAAEGPLWFQVYGLRDRDTLAQLVGRAERAGYRAIVLTADTPRLGNRRRDVRNGFALPSGVSAVNLPSRLAEPIPGRGSQVSAIAQHAAATHDATFSWSDLAWLREQTRLPLVVKGILSAADAARAADVGVDGIVVSSHGGRQLDRALPALHALPEVAEAVGDRCEVYLDGGIRHGTDILVAAALGARAVFVGRPVLWALAIGGAGTVEGLLTGMRDELEESMMLAGRADMTDLAGMLRARGAGLTC
ncbi:alpha-hydroxy acid oxidase [Streptomyces sp. NPDC050256]|uniref:alpha-hydroxy acid oxidase n=1 Tax=unclassified Streptomyces TaxID=2593676 RepID=UPI003797B701